MGDCLKASMDVDPELAKEVAATRQKMQGMQNMDFMGSYVSAFSFHMKLGINTSANLLHSISNMLAGGSESDPAPATSASGANTPVKAVAGGGNGGKRRKGR